jgi:hypothetical protein
MKRIAMIALLVAGGCATAPTNGGTTLPLDTQVPPDPPSAEAQSAYADANKALMSTEGQSLDAMSAKHAEVLSMYDRVLAMQPDYMDALNDKAWILATTPDPQLRKPRESLEMARQALDSIARTGMLRANREAFADDHTTGRMLVAATTFAAALAANGMFAASDSQVASDCVATAETVMAFVVESAASQNDKFKTPSTEDMLKRAREYQASFKQRKPLVGVTPLSSLLSPATRLR